MIFKVLNPFTVKKESKEKDEKILISFWEVLKKKKK